MGDLSYFNEDRFLPSPRRTAAYRKLVADGRNIAKSKRVVFAGLSRNIGLVAKKTIARLEHTMAMFKEASVVLFENDSKDNTREQLQDWAQQNKNVTILTETLGDPINPGIRCLDRAARMANYRNKYHDLIVEKYSDCDYVIVLDTDTNGWSYDGLANSLAQEIDWDGIGSNGVIFKTYEGIMDKQLYYDVWAFRWKEDWAPLAAGRLEDRLWPRGESMLPVRSCFGGLAVYKAEAFVSAKYDGSDCEHVPFHQKMALAGFDKLFMNPSQIVVY